MDRSNVQIATDPCRANGWRTNPLTDPWICGLSGHMDRTPSREVQPSPDQSPVVESPPNPVVQSPVVGNPVVRSWFDEAADRAYDLTHLSFLPPSPAMDPRLPEHYLSRADARNQLLGSWNVQAEYYARITYRTLMIHGARRGGASGRLREAAARLRAGGGIITGRTPTHRGVDCSWSGLTRAETPSWRSTYQSSEPNGQLRLFNR